MNQSNQRCWPQKFVVHAAQAIYVHVLQALMKGTWWTRRQRVEIVFSVKEVSLINQLFNKL